MYNENVSLVACIHYSLPGTLMHFTTQKVYTKRDLFKTLTSMNIAGDHHNRIIHRFIEL